MIECEAYHRVIDPWTKKAVAAWGWLIDQDGAEKYWVKIDDLQFAGAPYQLFSRRDWAEEFYYERTRLLRQKCRMRNARGPQKRGPKPRLIKQARAMGAGK